MRISAIIVSGGHSRESRNSVEILRSDGTPWCSLPELPYAMILTESKAIPSRASLHVGIAVNTTDNLASPSRMVYGPPHTPCVRRDGITVPGHLQLVLCFLEERTQIHPSHQSYYQTPREHLLYTFLSNILSSKIVRYL